MYIKPPSAFWLRWTYLVQLSTTSLGTKIPALRAVHCHDLADRHREVGVGSTRLIAPAAVFVLAGDDECDGLFEFLADFGPLRHAVAFGQEEAAEPVIVHWSVNRGPARFDKSRLAGAVEHIRECSLDDFAIGAFAGHVAGRHKCQPGKARDGDVADIATATE